MTTQKKLTSPWTEAEDDLIRLMAAANKSVLLVAAKLGRPVNSIKSRGRKLGVQFETIAARRKRQGSSGAWRPDSYK